ncbi:MAG: prepilin peptidase [Deltaproteobacteria bacterium]|nr:prepilin peptidase [Deltaproteobacteria bacterium]
MMKTPQTWFLLAALILAVINDLNSQKIPNRLTYPTMALSLIYWTGYNGWSGFLFSLAGILTGLAVLIVFYLAGGMGAGDVKLMAAVGGWLGPQGVFWAFLYTGIFGGVYALILILINTVCQERIKGCWINLKSFLLTQQFVPLPGSKEKATQLCYGLAIAAGTVFSILKKGG